jgi:hypothetical protein
MPSRFSRAFSVWMLALLLLADGLLILVQGPARAAPAGQAAALDHIVISEFRTRGPNGATDEFVELFNPTPDSIDIGGWLVRSVSSTGSMTTRATIPLGTQLLPGQYYLLATDDYSGPTPRDWALSAGFADNGGVALFKEIVIDLVGMSAGAAEGTPLPPLNGNLDQAYERKTGGSEGNCLDTDDNSFDFSLIAPSQPQNTNSDPTVCSSPSETQTETATFTDTLEPTFTSTFTLTPTFTATPAAPGHLVISELRFRGPLGGSDDFVELYNPTGAAVNIGNWQVRKSSGCGTSLSSLATIPANVILEPGQHYLLAGDNSSVAGLADQIFASPIADDGGVALVTAAGVMVDQVGLCAATTYREGQSLPALTQNADQGYERRPGGATSCYDTDDNAADFQLISPSQPQNRTAPAVMCAGVSLYTPTATATPTFTRTPTRTITPVPGVLVINEFLPHASTDWNADGRADVGDEYIEIMNVGTQSVNLRNWKLDDDVGGSSPFTLPDMTLQPRQIVRFYGSQSGILLNDGGDSVRLLRPGGQTADLFNYPAVTVFDRAWCRLPDGSGLWTFSCRPTPGRPNALAADLATPSPAPAATACPLTDSVPAVILEAECGRALAGPWRAWRGSEIWLQGADKWDTFLH